MMSLIILILRDNDFAFDICLKSVKMLRAKSERGVVMEEVIQENKMGVMPIKKLLITMSAPMMISMLVQALYNIVDSIFVARVCEDALTAVSMAFPIQSLLIAIGAGTDIAIEAADVVLMKSDLLDVPKAVTLSKKVIKNIKENLFWAFIYNAIGIPLAAGLLYPNFGILLNPMIAAAAMSCSSVSVVSNALRLRFAKL